MSEIEHRYTAEFAGKIESKWQNYWEQKQTFHVPNPGEEGFDASKPKKFIMDMFPYPSGAGLHVGHPLGYIATDIYSRYLRMRGYNVLHPMGFDAFGLPAEQFAIQTGQHPRVTTEKNIAVMRTQMRRLGLGHDPQRFLATIDVPFYKWTQWIFLQAFNAWFDEDAQRARPIEELIQQLESGRQPSGDVTTNSDGKPWAELTESERARVIDSYRLAFLEEVAVNWCPELGTVLANEEVTAEGRSERGNFPVFKRPLKQWMMRITSYCERLLADLGSLDWPEPIKLMQRNWIGRSEGAEVDFLALTESGLGVDSWFASRHQVGWHAQSPSEEAVIRVFTTRPDTLYGASYMVLAPEHALVDALTAKSWPAEAPASWRGHFPGKPTAESSPSAWIEAYRRYAAGRSDVERQVETKEKTGVFTGSYAVNPVNGGRVPIFIADYVLMGYGTGAIMAVPAHDERDFEFATQFELPIPPVVLPPASWLREHVAPHLPSGQEAIDPLDDDGLASVYQHAGDDSHEHGGLYRLTEAFSGEGISIHSSSTEGLPTSEAKAKITEWLQERGLGKGAVNYRLRDWLFSRQRYWGEPFPILHSEDGRLVALREDELPLELPTMDDYRPEVNADPDSLPQPPLGRAKEWAKVTRDGKDYIRELNTMPNWAGSCWYYLRYLDPHNHAAMVDSETERYWMLIPKKGKDKNPENCEIGGVDLYVGGAEHAVLHLLYARFWHKILYDLGHVSTPEPFQRLFNQGYVQAPAYLDERGMYVDAGAVEERDGQYFYDGKEVTREEGKMGKSLKNSVTPDEIFQEYGADTLRLYEMYMGPLDASKQWNTRDIVGSHRFLQRLWRNLVDEATGELTVSSEPASDELTALLHRTISGVQHDMENLAFNTAIAKLIELNNALVSYESVPLDVVESIVKMIAPMAPHFAEELWERLGHSETIAYESYPEFDPALLVEESIEIPVMINGKVRDRFQIAPEAAREEYETAARALPKIQELLGEKSVKKVVAVPKRMVNFVV